MNLSIQRNIHGVWAIYGTIYGNTYIEYVADEITAYCNILLMELGILAPNESYFLTM